MEHSRFDLSRQESPVVYTCAYDRDLPGGIRFGPVIRDIYFIECNTGGYGSIIINDQEFPVGPGDCYFILPGDTVTYTTHPTNPRQGVWCSVDGLQVGWALSQAGITSQNPYAPRELFPKLVAQIEALAGIRDQTDPGAQLRRSAHIYAFLGILLSRSTSQSPADWLSRVIGYMEANYYKPIAVADLAREAYLERSYFSVRFKELTGQSPHAYLTSLRIQKARTLMFQTHCSVTRAAELVGLNPRNFARIFKRETGVTPKTYKNHHDSPQAQSSDPFH